MERRPRAGLAEPSSTRAGNVCMSVAMCECICQRENVCVFMCELECILITKIKNN